MWTGHEDLHFCGLGPRFCSFMARGKWMSDALRLAHSSTSGRSWILLHPFVTRWHLRLARVAARGATEPWTVRIQGVYRRLVMSYEYFLDALKCLPVCGQGPRVGRRHIATRATANVRLLQIENWLGKTGVLQNYSVGNAHENLASSTINARRLVSVKWLESDGEVKVAQNVFFPKSSGIFLMSALAWCTHWYGPWLMGLFCAHIVVQGILKENEGWRTTFFLLGDKHTAIAIAQLPFKYQTLQCCSVGMEQSVRVMRMGTSLFDFGRLSNDRILAFSSILATL